MKSLPKARPKRDLVVEELEGELLVYDRSNHQAHRLNRAASIIWRRCDGETSIETVITELASEGIAVDETLVEAAVESLREAKLLTVRSSAAVRSRREIFKHVGLMAGIVIVTSIVAPSVAQAASCGGPGQPCCSGACDPPLDCISGFCS